MSRYLFSISIGPVQEFIAAARKTRDLWFGSEILSELSKATARAARDANADLIFPAPTEAEQLQSGSSLSVANKLLFVANSEDPASLVAELRAAVRACLNEHTELAHKIATGDGLEIREGEFRAQLENFSEFYAAWVPFPDDNRYEEQRKQVDQFLAARKSLRNFAQHTGSSAEKNTIDGVRESVIIAASIERSLGCQVKPNERLDAVGLLKRFGRKGAPPVFDSTHDLAAVPYVRQLLRLRTKDPAVDRWLNEYRSLATSLAPDATPFLNGLGNVLPGRLLTPDSEDHLDGKDAPKDPARRKTIEQVNHLRSALQKHVHTVHKVKPPAPYYAVLLADGDHMGKALNSCKSPQQHQEFSRLLSAFAKRARERLETVRPELFSGLGAVVYAGGDDMLVFLPLDTALEAARVARDAFLEAMEPIRQKLSVAGEMELPTLSAALVIAHAQEDLTAVLAQAHHTLDDIAKAKYHRNALALTLMRRSGAPFTTGGPWDQALGLAAKLLAAYAEREVPFGLGYEWRELAGRCRRAGLNGDLVPQWARAVLQQKGEKPAGHLDRVIDEYVKDPASLERLAHQLVLAKALHDGGAQPAPLTGKAHE